VRIRNPRKEFLKTNLASCNRYALDHPADRAELLMRVIAVFLLVAVSFAARAAETAADQTPVTQCDGLPLTVSIEVFSKSDTVSLCRQALRVLEGVTVDDLRTFETAAYLFSAKGYEPGK